MKKKTTTKKIIFLIVISILSDSKCSISPFIQSFDGSMLITTTYQPVLLRHYRSELCCSPPAPSTGRFFSIGFIPTSILPKSEVPIHSTSLQSNPIQHNPGKMSQFLLRESNIQITMGATSSTHESSTQSSLPTSSTQLSVEENIGIQHQGYLLGSTGLDGLLYIGVRDKELFPSGPCSSIIYESFGERADLNGYSWVTLSDETKLLYWDEFHKKCHWDEAKTPRRGVADGQALSTHTGGSASHSKIASDLKKLWGHDPAHHELLLYTHTKNHDGVTFLVDKAKKIHDDFMERCDRLEAIGEEIDEEKLFYDVVGGHDRKKRLYGFGSYGKRIRSSKGSSEMHREQYEDNNAETKVEIENMKKLVETQREQYEDIQQKYEDVQQKYEDAQKKNVEFQQKNVDVQAKFEQLLAQAMNVINTLSEQKNGKGEDPLWGDVFKQTHLEKSANMKLASGELIGSQPEH
ncbi:unnamed protein product [Lactuca virosa]|uniref:Uncharacterized protein n=1 Tax=Lactuca virosa TaxID=75947 RepID=A0AAU9NGH8_9ASTR|nr:unnamed protein product [Lactuca virosa]